MPDGNPLAIDPLTDKPKINFVVPSDPVEGEIPVDMENEVWQKAPERYIAMGGQITHKPRNFVNRIDDIWVSSLYNDKVIVYLLDGTTGPRVWPRASCPGPRRR